MKISSLINPLGNPQKETTIISFNNGNELLLHYGTPVAGFWDGMYIKSRDFHSQTTSKNVNLYLCGVEAAAVDQIDMDSYIDKI